MSRRAQKAARAAARSADRAARGGGRAVALAPQYAGGALGPSDEWFGPGRPLDAVAPASVRGRRLDFQFGTNLNVTPRQSEWTSFETLRALADRHDLTRMAIETAKDRMVRLNWGFRVLDSDQKLTAEQEARARKLRAFFRRPDGRRFWVDWLRMVLEDLLVIDAPAIYVRRTMDESEVVGLVQIDGALIKPVLDAWGNEPEPPEAAYQQVLHGMPAVNYTSRQLVYRPRNQRVHRVYGFSPVEQILATINIALRRQVWQHAYFTDGNIPDSLIGVPSTWTPDQIRDFQDWFDGILTGDTAQRRRARFVPGEVAKSYVPTKDAEMFGAAEEWLARVVCFCFGIPHQALVKEVNRATADNAYEQAIEDGLAPIMGWVKSVMDGLLCDHLGETELEFWWVTDKPVDPKVLDEIWKARVDAGAANRNEWRRAVGMEPASEPEAEMLLYMGKPLGVDDQIDQQTRRNDSGVFPSAVGHEDQGSASGGAEGSGGGEGEQPSSSPPSGKEEGASKAAAPFGVAGDGDRASKVAEPHDPDSLTAGQLAAFRALSPERPAAERARRALQVVLQRALSRVGGRVVAAVEAELQRLQAGPTKADDPDTSGVPTVGSGSYVLTDLGLAQWEEGLISVAIEAVGSLDFIIDATAEQLAAVAADTTRQAVAQIGGWEPAEDIVDQVSARSVEAAEERAAELVGRRVLADGTIIDNPDARWAISQSTRDMIKTRIETVIRENEGSDALIRSLEDEHAFSPARAEMVSRTEIADVNSRAAMTTYHAAQEAGVDVLKRWVLGSEPCDVCTANAHQGAIPLDDSFQSGDMQTPAHPHCVCATIPEVE